MKDSLAADDRWPKTLTTRKEGENLQDTEFIAILYDCEESKQLLGLTFGIVYCFAVPSSSSPLAIATADLIIVRKNLLKSQKKKSFPKCPIYRMANN